MIVWVFLMVLVLIDDVIGCGVWDLLFIRFVIGRFVVCFVMF